MDDLFPDLPEVLSPKLAWMNKHGVITFAHKMEPQTWFAGFQVWWPKLDALDFFVKEVGEYGDSRVGQGDSENEAITDLLTCGYARQKNIKHWTLE